MDSINVNLDNLTESEREQLMALVQKGNANKSKVWKPTNGEHYWVINSAGYASELAWDNDEVDNKYFALGNCYQSEEDANFAVEKQKVLVELQRYADEHNEGKLSWEDWSENKYYIYYDHYSGKLDIHSNQFLQSNVTYFTSDRIGYDAIKAVGEDRIRKYLFNIF